ncbi:arylsulfatase A-like enzyme [Maribacter vaceletii]|uniref:Arylsulfatase A-like enzyme n=1 Tax=Maribacter vaceletii TaxID=1206816 RepID=A0A495EDM1_9FLAO|nr:arylsulfatase [Maribacter vaceletii]RKR14985.1 arylsulfatase A-like enzyme [Maribacter vaceletii]
MIYTFKKQLFQFFFLNISLIFSLANAQEQPNVVVILADDIGVGDISHYRKINSDKIIVETPTIDKLSESGMIFTNAHSPAALCAPSRYAIMTGNHCYRSDFPWGVWGAYQESPIKPNQLTLGKLMKNAGYQTAFFGKWHLGGNYFRKGDTTQIYRGLRNKPETEVDIRKIVSGGPQSNGFDYSVTLAAGIQASPYAVYENGNMMPLQNDSRIDYISQKDMDKIGVKLDKLEGLGDSNWDPHLIGGVLANKAISYIEKREEKKPFFMYYSTQAVHLPHTPSKELNGKKVAGTTPSNHLDLVKELDIQIEMLVQSLKKKKLYDNTLIIITSDNGGLHTPNTLKANHNSSSIYRGHKNLCYEGGHRVPFIASWPNKIKPNSKSDVPIIGLDVMATLAEITNQELDSENALDSSSLLPIFLGESNLRPHPFLMLQSGTAQEGIIIDGDFKLIITIDKKDKTYTTRKPYALFNLKKDPTEKEKNNLINNPNYKKTVNLLFKKYNTTRDSKIITGIR